MNDVSHLTGADAVLPSEVCMGDAAPRVAQADGFSILGGDLRPGSPLVPHIGRVFQRRAEEQVIRSHARGHVAPMADVCPLGDRAVVQFPRNTRRDENETIPASFADLAVAAWNGGARPQPTRVSLVDLGPEPFGQRSGAVAPLPTDPRRCVASAGAVQAATDLHIAGASQKGRSAGLTHAGNGRLSAHSDPPVWVPSPRPFERRGGAFVPTIVPVSQVGVGL